MSLCNWCGEDLSGPPRSIYYDDLGKKCCSLYCAKESNKSREKEKSHGRRQIKRGKVSK